MSSWRNEVDLNLRILFSAARSRSLVLVFDQNQEWDQLSPEDTFYEHVIVLAVLL